jgi:hypothetical protein
MADLFYFTLKLLFLLFRNQTLFLSEGDVILSLKVSEVVLYRQFHTARSLRIPGRQEHPQSVTTAMFLLSLPVFI